jgi:hypothetical protein
LYFLPLPQGQGSVKKPHHCPLCRCRRIYWNGSRERSASVLEGDNVSYLTDILCRRVKCAGCKKSWTLRPPGLMPRRHYQLGVVARATRQFLFEPHSTLTSVARAHQCCRRTVGRWLRWIGDLASPSALIRRLSAISGESSTTGEDGRIERIFELLEALGRAYGFRFPFGGLIEAVIADRDRVSTYRSPAIPELAR